MFGNSEGVRQSNYIHEMEDDDYAALGGLYDSAVLPDESVKKSPLISPYFGRIWDIITQSGEFADERMTYSDLCKMLCKERGVDEDMFNQVVAVHPVVGRISSFVNSLLIEAYDDTPGSVSLLSLVWKCGHAVVK